MRKVELNLDYFVARSDVSDDGCWSWRLRKDADGYGHCQVAHHVSVLAHRVSFTVAKGPIPDGLTIDHLCRNRSCVNPDHLEAVTQAENTRRSPLSPSTINAAKTSCVNGHEFTPENTRTTGNLRTCRACVRAASARYQARRAQRRVA